MGLSRFDGHFGRWLGINRDLHKKPELKPTTVKKLQSKRYDEALKTQALESWLQSDKPEVREDSGPRYNGISDNENSDQKTIYIGVQSPGRGVGGPWETSA